jgi:hypothetical protein
MRRVGQTLSSQTLAQSLNLQGLIKMSRLKDSLRSSGPPCLRVHPALTLHKNDQIEALRIRLHVATNSHLANMVTSPRQNSE